MSARRSARIAHATSTHIDIHTVPARRKHHFSTKTVGTVRIRELRATRDARPTEAVPPDGLGHERVGVGSKEGVACEHAETVGKGSDLGLIGRVVAREVVDDWNGRAEGQ